MRILTFVAAIVVGVAGWLPAQTVDFSPANLDGTQPVPGRVFTATLTCPQGVGAAYVLAFDIFPATPPIKLAGFGELGLGMTPAFMIMKAGGLNAQGKDTFSLALPNAPALVGARFYLQALVYAPAAPQGAWLSNLYVGDISAAGTHTLVPNRAMIPRALHTATLLNDGRVLIVGGGNGTLTNPQGTQTTEVYYPWTKKFDYTRTTQGTVTRLNGLRVMHTATLLDDGRVLIAGGVDSQGNVLATAEVFDPATGRFAYVGNLVQARATHSATKLPDGRVLIAGGTTANFVYPNVFGGASNSTEVFDPGTSAFKSGPSMGDKHMLHSAVSLTYNNKDYVVVLSGIKGLSLFIFPSYSSKADVYDVAAGSFTGKIDGRSVGSVRSARAAMGAAVQGNGRVLVVGGVNGSVPGATADAEELNPVTATFGSAPSIPTARAAPTTTTLPNGQVIVQGGVMGSLTAPTATASCYLYVNSTFQATGSLQTTRGAHTAVLLNSGVVWVLGGGDTNATALDTAEYYTP